MKEISNYELRITNAGWESISPERSELRRRRYAGCLSTACKNLVILALILNSQFAILNSSAAVPLKWTVETSRATPAQFEAYHGETLTLEADLQSDGKPLALSGIAALYWQTNGMGSAYWEATAAVNSNRLSAVWTPEMDVGARVYNCFIGQPGKIYHAAFQLRLHPSPGATPNILPLPVPVIDFARVRVLNPPWGSGGGGVDTNAVEVIANEAVKTNAVTVGLLSSVSNRYTKDETDALLSGKQADIGIVKDAYTVVMPEDRSLAVQGALYVTGSANISGSLNAAYITVDNKEVALRADIPEPYTPPPYLRAYDEVRKCWWRGRMVNGVINWEVE